MTRKHEEWPIILGNDESKLTYVKCKKAEGQKEKKEEGKIENEHSSYRIEGKLHQQLQIKEASEPAYKWATLCLDYRLFLSLYKSHFRSIRKNAELIISIDMSQNLSEWNQMLLLVSQMESFIHCRKKIKILIQLLDIILNSCTKQITWRLKYFFFKPKNEHKWFRLLIEVGAHIVYVILQPIPTEVSM